MKQVTVPSSSKSKRAAVNFADTKSNKRFVELFAGIGLVRMGLERTGWECVYANDIDSNKKEIYSANFSDQHFHLEDIWKISTDDLPSSFELITASFPCVDLSLAGNRKGLAGDHSGTFWAFIQLIEKLKQKKAAPKAVLVENVLGFMSSNDGKDFIEAIRALNEQGYVTDSFVVDARNFTPQSRPRLFIVGINKSEIPLTMAMPNDPGKSFERILNSESHKSRPAALRRLISENKNLGWGLFDLPKIEPHTVRFSDVIEEMPDSDPRWWDKAKVQKTLDQMSELHSGHLAELIGKKTFSYGTIYRRKRAGGTMCELRLDGFAGCLRTPRGGSSRQIVARIGKNTVKIRWMTPREYARLQGAGDDFVLSPNDTKSLFGFGDAVCVPAIEWIARNTLDPIFHESSREIKKS